MEIEPAVIPAIVFSDLVIRDQNTGKLTLVGVFQRFKAGQAPFTTPQFYATVLVTNLRGQPENVPVRLDIEDQDGDKLSTATGVVSATAHVLRNDVAEIAFPMPPTRFERADQYKAVVSVNDEILGSRSFSVQVE